jgi:chromate transporter
MAGANAAVVGVLAAALYAPIWTSAVFTPIDFALAALGFIALVQFRVSPIWVVLGGGLVGAGLSRF